MNDKLVYPKTLEELEVLIGLMYQIKMPEEKEKLSKWEEWFNNNKSKVIIDLNDDQYLKVYYDDKKYSLQAWKHLEEYDFLEYYVLSNYYDEFVTDKTIITNANVDKLINKKYALNLLDEHIQGKKDNSRKVWTVFMFCLWYELYIEGKSDEGFFS